MKSDGTLVFLKCYSGNRATVFCLSSRDSGIRHETFMTNSSAGAESAPTFWILHAQIKKKSVTYGALMYCFSSSLSTSAYPMSPVMNLFREKKRGWPAKDNHWQISPLRHVLLSKCIIIMWPPRGNVAEARWTRKRVFLMVYSDTKADSDVALDFVKLPESQLTC